MHGREVRLDQALVSIINEIIFYQNINFIQINNANKIQHLCHMEWYNIRDVIIEVIGKCFKN